MSYRIIIRPEPERWGTIDGVIPPPPGVLASAALRQWSGVPAVRQWLEGHLRIANGYHLIGWPIRYTIDPLDRIVVEWGDGPRGGPNA